MIRFKLNTLLLLGAIVLAGCGGGGGDTPASTETVTLSGKVTYDLVPKNFDSIGLDYGNITQEAVKGMQVDAIDSGNHIIESTTTDSIGNYAFSIIKNTDVKIRVSAKLFKSGTPSWDVQVVDNTNSDALYVMEGALSSVGESDSTRNLNAPSGWGVSSYTSSRVAAPFAMLDTVYSSMKKILSADASANFAALKVNWSTLNTTTSGDTTAGQIGTSHYTNSNLYILGDEDLDTDEYDDHIIAHEWGHYYEDKFSRSDSIGGSHGSGDILDIRVAFGEGWGNAFSGMVFDDPIYFDTTGLEQASGFNFNVESDTFSHPGWYSEDSVQQILYNLYDSSNSGNDSLSLGFEPIHSVFVGEQKTTPAFTSIFTFIKLLKDANSGIQTEIDAIVSDENIITISDIYGTGRTNKTASYPYHDLNIGTPVSVQITDADGVNNKLSNRKYVKFTIASDSTYTIKVAQTNATDSDPDFYLYRSSPFGFVTSSDGTDAGVEEKSIYLTVGSYILDVADYKNVAAADLDVTVN